jgi:hypothetical protein
MTITLDELRRLLIEHKQMPREEPVYISFGGERRNIPRSIDYEASDSSILVLDLDAGDKVLGIEIV